MNERPRAHAFPEALPLTPNILGVPLIGEAPMPQGLQESSLPEPLSPPARAQHPARRAAPPSGPEAPTTQSPRFSHLSCRPSFLGLVARFTVASVDGKQGCVRHHCGVILLCRYSSRRLPGKILLPLGGRPVLEHIVQRVRLGAPELPLVVATSRIPADDCIAAWCDRHGVDCFRGDHLDVANRFLSAAEARGFEYAVRVNGDRPLLDPGTLAEMTAVAASGEYDLVTNLPSTSFPPGLTVEIVRTRFLREEMDRVTDPYHREHVTSWLYEEPRKGRVWIHEGKYRPRATAPGLALDTAEDLHNLERILRQAGSRPEELSLGSLFELACAEEVR